MATKLTFAAQAMAKKMFGTTKPNVPQIREMINVMKQRETRFCIEPGCTQEFARNDGYNKCEAHRSL